jgi:hypothetical protein
MSLLLLAALTLCAQTTDSGWAGSWAGEWTGAQAGGGIKFKFAQIDGKWTAETSFTLADAEVPAKVTSFKIDGDSMELVDEFDLQGNKLSSKVTGKKTGTTVEGKYTTTADGNDVDSGTFKATLKK